MIYKSSTNHKRRTSGGFTLIEIMMVALIFGFLAITINNVLISSLNASDKGETIKEVRQNGDVAMSIMTQHFTNAYNTNCAAGSTNSLKILNTDNIWTHFYIVTDPTSKIRQIAMDSGTSINPDPDDIDPTILTSNLVSVSKSQDLTFDCSQYASLGIVQIRFTLEYVPGGNVLNVGQTRSSEQAIIPFQTSIKHRTQRAL